MSVTTEYTVEQLLRFQFPLHYSCFLGDDATVELLLQSNLSAVDLEDDFRKWTPMHWAACGGHDFMGETPLHKAARIGDLACVKLLTSYGPTLSVFNQYGQTALEVAVQAGHIHCAAFLEEATVSQHSSFLQTSSSPILMNGEGIYQSMKPPVSNNLTMQMDEDMDSAGDAMACQPRPNKKRMLEDNEPTNLKRQRLFEPTTTEKLGTFINNNVLSSYNSILATSVEPAMVEQNQFHNQQQVHAMAGLPPKPDAYDIRFGIASDVNSTSSVMDLHNSLQAQHGYDASLFSMIHDHHGS